LTSRVWTKIKKQTKGIPVARDEFLKTKPLRHPESKWEKNERGLHVTIPRKRTLLFSFFSKFLPLVHEKRMLLDEQGGFVWNLCDGEHPIKEIAKRLSERYKMRVSDAEAALDLYFVQLSEQNLVGFLLPDSAKERYHKKFDTKEKQKMK